MYTGIDYGLGQTNIDLKTGIRYGCISQHSIVPEALDDFDMDYGDAHCPQCGNEAVDNTSECDKCAGMEDFTPTKDYHCHACVPAYCFWADMAFSEEVQGMTYEGEGYSIEGCLDSDLIVTRSEFYAYAPFCSPCVPGAGNLDNAPSDAPNDHEGYPRVFCLAHDWFENGRAPYRVFRVSDNIEVFPMEGK